jgi:hypothetical protein
MCCCFAGDAEIDSLPEEKQVQFQEMRCAATGRGSMYDSVAGETKKVDGFKPVSICSSCAAKLAQNVWASMCLRHGMPCWCWHTTCIPTRLCSQTKCAKPEGHSWYVVKQMASASSSAQCKLPLT